MSGTSWLLEQLSSCRVAYCYVILKARIMTMGSSGPWVMYILRTYRLIVYRVVTKLLLHDRMTTLVAVLLSLSLSSFSLTQFCMKVKCNVDNRLCLTQWLIFHMFPNMTPNFIRTGPNLTTTYNLSKFSKWNWFRLDSFRHDISTAI